MNFSESIYSIPFEIVWKLVRLNSVEKELINSYKFSYYYQRHLETIPKKASLSIFLKMDQALSLLIPLCNQ